MKRFLVKIGRFFWSWGFLKFVLWSVTLIALLYVEEDWRGARMWAQTKAKWEAKGETFDYSRFIPPPIPDSENLGALPLFKLEPDLQYRTQVEPLALRTALHQDVPGFSISLSGNAQKRQMPDFHKLARDIAANYEIVFHAAPATNDPLAQLDAIYPFIEELNGASATHPFCRFDVDYTSQPAFGRAIGSITEQLPLAKALSIHASLALEKHRPDLALSDAETGLKLNSGIVQEPILVSGLVAVANAALAEGALNNGLALHAWNDAQLSQLESDLNQFNFLGDYQLVMRGELTGFSIPTLDYLKNRRRPIADLLYGSRQSSGFLSARIQDFVSDLWPGGWLDQNKSQDTDAMLGSLAYVDPINHRAFPTRADESEGRVRRATRQWDSFAPWNIFTSITLGPVLNAAVVFTRGQVQLDEARIALALERYHLAHGDYPAALDELAPAYIDDVPHDVINGESYRYRLRPDGTFLLYSVGWNETDEGGLVVTSISQSDDPNDTPNKHGDWVWPTLK